MYGLVLLYWHWQVASGPLLLDALEAHVIGTLVGLSAFQLSFAMIIWFIGDYRRSGMKLNEFAFWISVWATVCWLVYVLMWAASGQASFVVSLAAVLLFAGLNFVVAAIIFAVSYKLAVRRTRARTGIE